MAEYAKICPICGKEFLAKKSNAVYCCRSCGKISRERGEKVAATRGALIVTQNPCINCPDESSTDACRCDKWKAYFRYSWQNLRQDVARMKAEKET